MLTLGLDVGGSTTKAAAIRDNGAITAVLQVKASDQLTSLYGALGRFLYENSLKLSDISRIVLTGVGASFIDTDIYGIPTIHVKEFEAIGKGGLMLSGLSRALVISMGTGTAFVNADGSDFRHIGGSGIGGGTLLGLSSKILHENNIEAVLKYAEQGDLANVDLLIEDICCGEISNLPPTATAANFGKVRSTANKSDFALGLINAVIQNAGVLASFACLNSDCKTAVAVGSLACIPQAKEILDGVGSLNGLKFIIPDKAIFATALGAAALADEI